MDAHECRDEGSPVEFTPHDSAVDVWPDRPLTLTDTLNRAEVLAMRGRVARKPVAQVKRTPFGISPYELAPRLKPVDRICQRWAVSVGDGLPNTAWDAPTKSRPTPLDRDTAIVVDTIIMKGPPSSRRLLVKWYRSDAPVSAIADQMIEQWHGRKRNRLTNWRGKAVEELKQSLQMTENGVILCWNLTLDELRQKFEASKRQVLIDMLLVEY